MSRLPIPSAIFLAALLVPLCRAQQLPSGHESPLPLRYPELARAAVPSWLAPGLRATYEELASTRTTERDTAGCGIVQIDVVAIEPDRVAQCVTAYVPATTGALRPLAAGSFGGLASPGCGAFWCHPEVLAAIPAAAEDVWTVQRVPFTDGGKEYQSIRFDVVRDPFRYALIYELASGLLLYEAVDYVSADKGQVEHGTLRLRNVRTLSLPWKDFTRPDWVQTGLTLNYRGQGAVQVPGAAPLLTNVEVGIQVAEVTASACRARFSVAAQGQLPATIDSVSGGAHLMGFWLPAAAMEALAPGAVDEDPDTRMKISVVKNDSSGLVMEKTNGVDYRLVFAYDREGRLVETREDFDPDVVTEVGFNTSRRQVLQIVR